MHICGEEIGAVAVVLTAIGSFIKPVRDCVKCQAIYLYNKMRKK